MAKQPNKLRNVKGIGDLDKGNFSGVWRLKPYMEGVQKRKGRAKDVTQ
jgi:hypothetical protein